MVNSEILGSGSCSYTVRAPESREQGEEIVTSDKGKVRALKPKVTTVINF